MTELKATKTAAKIAIDKLDSVCVFEGVKDEDLEIVSMAFEGILTYIRKIQNGDVKINLHGYPIK